MYKYWTDKDRCKCPATIHNSKCWLSLESEHAKKMSGGGMWAFRMRVLFTRGLKCESCLKEFSRKELHIHHIEKVAEFRWLRFEPFNVLVLCVYCHPRVEDGRLPTPAVGNCDLISYKEAYRLLRNEYEKDTPEQQFSRKRKKEKWLARIARRKVAREAGLDLKSR